MPSSDLRGFCWFSSHGINRFRVVRQFGEGGFTIVYVVKDITVDKKSIDPVHVSGIFNWIIL